MSQKSKKGEKQPKSGKKEKGCGIWWLSWKILYQRGACIPIVGFAVGFAWVLSASLAYLNLMTMMTEPAVIRGEMTSFSAEQRQYIKSLNGVQAVTKLYESEASVTIKEYTGTIAVYGVEEDYFKQLMTGNMSADIPFSQGMPYGLLCQSAALNLKKPIMKNQNGIGNAIESSENESLNQMKKQDDQKDGLILSDDMLLEDFEVNSSTVRLYGWIADAETGDRYITNKKLETQMHDSLTGTGSTVLSGVYVLDEWWDQLLEVPEEKDDSGVDTGIYNPGESETMKILIMTEHGWQVLSLMRQLNDTNIACTSQIETLLEETNKTGQNHLYTGAAVCICCIFICIYQEKLWLKQHYRWLEMLKQFYYDFHIYGKLMRRKYVILLGMSLLGSGIWQWLSMIFEW